MHIVVVISVQGKRWGAGNVIRIVLQVSLRGELHCGSLRVAGFPSMQWAWHQRGVTHTSRALTHRSTLLVRHSPL